MSTQAISADNPLPGYYWMRRERGGKRIPIAIWRKDGELVCRAGPDVVPPLSVWTWCADNKISAEAAKFAFDKGYFQDEPPPIGHNAPPSDDPFEALKADIDAKQKQAEDWLAKRPTITTQRDSDYAANAQRELLALVKRADTMHKAEKEPILEATRACDDRYRFRDAVNAVAVKLRQVFERFMVAEERRLKEDAAANLRAEQARVAAERKRLEDERAAKLRDDPIAALTEAPPEMPELPLEPEAVKVQSGGGTGRRAGLQDVWTATITDYREAALYFIEHPKLREVVDKLVLHQVKDLKASARIPGVDVKKERRAA